MYQPSMGSKYRVWSVNHALVFQAAPFVSNDRRLNDLETGETVECLRCLLAVDEVFFMRLSVWKNSLAWWVCQAMLVSRALAGGGFLAEFTGICSFLSGAPSHV